MPNKDFYAILGVPKTATEDEIKKSFRRLAHEHHPDKGGDPGKFKDINEAYQVLGDKEKRARYDQFGSAAFDPNNGFGGAGGPGFGGFEGMNINFEDFGDLGDILGGMFGFGGGGGRRPRQKQGAHIETEITIDFLESVKGVKKRVNLYKHVACDVCGGSGAEPGAKMEKCPTCGGQGAVQRATRTIFGTVQTAVPCPDCEGRGERPSAKCKHCKGFGVERKQVELDLDIPPGLVDGQVVQVQGQGEHPGSGGRPGDLYVRINVKAHPTFSRDGEDVLSTAYVPYSLLVLGGETEIETVDGPGTLKIPEATRPGTVFKIRGKGIAFGRSGNRGDQLVTVQAEVKKNLSREQKQAIEELKKLGL